MKVSHAVAFHLSSYIVRNKKTTSSMVDGRKVNHRKYLLERKKKRVF